MSESGAQARKHLSAWAELFRLRHVFMAARPARARCAPGVSGQREQRGRWGALRRACAGLLGVACLCGAGVAAAASTCTAVAGTSNWGTAATWTGCGGTAPGNGDNVVIPSGATVILNVDTADINDLNVNLGGVLRGDNTNKIFTIKKGSGVDITNNGTIDFGAGNLATIFLKADSQWTGTGAWNLSVIDIGTRKLTFNGGSTLTINMSGAASPLINPGSVTSLATISWNFSGTVAQTLPGAANVSYGDLTVSNTAGVTLGIDMTSSQLLGNLTVAANGILKNGGFAVTLAAGKSFSVGAGAQFNLTGTSTMVAVSGGGAKTFNATSTVTYGGAAQTVTAETYGNLVLGGSGVKTMPAALITTANDFTISGTALVTAAQALVVGRNFTIGSGTSFAAKIFNHSVAGDFLNSGTFLANSSTITFTGGLAQALGGTATTPFNNLTISKSSNNVTMTCATPSPTVNSTLTLTTGRIVTAGTSPGCSTACGSQVPVILAPAAVLSGGSSSSYVYGALRKSFNAGLTLNFRAAGLDEFPVGDATNYTPIEITAGGTSTAGSVTACVTAAEHPNIATSGLDATKSVNRYWSLTASGINTTSGAGAASVAAIFKFVAGDVDAGANTANFEIETWNGVAWNTTTVGARTATSTQASGITVFGDFAVAEKKSLVPTPGSFNAFESLPFTPAAATTGRIFTKLAGTGFSLDVVAISGGAQQGAFTNSVSVELVANTTGAALGADNCPTTFTSIQGPTTVTITGGRSTVVFAAVATAYRNVRVRVRFPVASPTVTSCSTDNFAIRPVNFTSVTSSMTNTGSTGAPVARAGDTFTLTANTNSGFDGTPSINNALLTAHAGAVQVGAVGGTFGVAASGVAIGSSFTYSEVGNFTLGAGAVFDSGFTSVDPPGTDCTNDFSNSLTGGQYGCKFGNSAAAGAFGRFTPDHFDVAFNTPVFGAACGGFTYIGQSFSYTTAPLLTVTARNSAALGNATTRNYTGASWWKLSNATLTYPGGTSRGYAAFAGTLDISGLPATDPVVVDSGGAASGAGTLTFGSSLRLTRTTPVVPFNADIGLSINVIDADGIAYASNPAAFGAATAGGGISFGAGGKEMRFGRLRMSNAHGLQFYALPIPFETQYWNSSGTGFVTNTADSCTTIVAANVGLGNYTGNLNAGETTVTVSSPLAAGRGKLRLSAPGADNNGGVDVAVNLTAGTTSAACTAGITTTAGANLTHLQGAWCDPAYIKDPQSRATFGVYKNSNQFIYQRENF